METLTIGDRVLWRGGWGDLPARHATVIGIERVQQGEKYGTPVRALPWASVKANAVVSLDNGHWAYGYQIERA